MQVELVSWEAVYMRCRSVAGRIREAGFRPEVIVAIARGGYVPARLLCDFLDVRDLTSIRVEHYGGGAAKAPRTELRFPLSGDIGGRRVLLVDDVNDSGETLAVALPHLQQFEPAALRTAVLDHKRVSPVAVDFCGRRVEQWHWITYPWAVIEDIDAFLGRLEPAPRDAQEARERLARELGIRVSPQLLEDVARFGTRKD